MSNENLPDDGTMQQTVHNTLISHGYTQIHTVYGSWYNTRFYEHPTKKPVVVLDELTTGKQTVLQEITLYDLVSPAKNTSTGWGIMDFVERAAENHALTLTQAQAAYLINEHGDELDKITAQHGIPVGWDRVDEILEDINNNLKCDTCTNAINVVGDDDDSSYQLVTGGAICPTCYNNEDKDYISCETCEKYLERKHAGHLIHNPSEASYYCPACLVPKVKQQQEDSK